MCVRVFAGVCLNLSCAHASVPSHYVFNVNMCVSVYGLCMLPTLKGKLRGKKESPKIVVSPQLRDFILVQTDPKFQK